MRRAVMQARLWVGRRLVGLGFLIAPDAYWTAFEGKIREVQLVDDK